MAWAGNNFWSGWLIGGHRYYPKWWYGDLLFDFDEEEREWLTRVC